MYACSICDHQESRQINLKMHNQSVHQGIKYSCPICGLKFSREGTLSTHIAEKHKERKYKCSNCDLEFNSYSSRRDHKQATHDVTKYNCDICQFSTHFLRNLKQHAKTHKIDNKETFACKTCTYVGPTKHALAAHNKRVHQVQSLVTCDKCNKTIKPISLQ